MSHTIPKQSLHKHDFIQENFHELVIALQQHSDEEIFDILRHDFQGLLVDLDGNLTIPKTPYHHTEYLALWVLAHTVPTLKKLNLTRSHLVELPANFHAFKELSSLNLNHNRFSSIPEVISKLPSLQELCLVGNFFTVHAQSFQNKIRLDIRGLEVQSIPKDVHDLIIYGDQLHELLPKLATSHVQKLTIEDFEDVASEIVLGQLTELSIQSSLVKNLPPFLSKCPNLEVLSWEYGHILYWPDNLYLPKLQKLSLRHNRIAWLSGNIRRHTHLQKIDLSHNSLRIVPQSIRNCTHITSLNLSHNQLNKFEIESELMSDLLHLDLSHNPLEHISAHISAQKLLSLNISETKMEATPSLLSYVYGVDFDGVHPLLDTPLITDDENLLRSLQVSSLLRFLSSKTVMDELDLSHQQFRTQEEIALVLEKAQPQTLWLWKTYFPDTLPESTPRPKVVYAENSIINKLPESWQDIIIKPKLFSVAILSPFSKKSFRSLLLEIHPDIFSHSYEIPHTISLPFGQENYYCTMFAQRDILLKEVSAPL